MLTRFPDGHKPPPRRRWLFPDSMTNVHQRFVLRLEPGMFRLVMDAIMRAAGLSMPWNAAFS
jgi:hypothetical protein